MALEIKVLDLGDIEVESSFLVLGRNMGTLARVPTYSMLILGGSDPMLVDTGYVHPEIMANLGMRGIQTEEQRLVNQLARHGVRPKDVRWIFHTHLHIDHAGLTATPESPFPASTIPVINRRELEFSVSGVMGGQYPPSYIKPLVDRLHEPDGLRLVDLEESGAIEFAPGLYLEAAGGHTEGSMNILVETREGVACICGDVIYDINHQIVKPHLQNLKDDPATTGNHSQKKREEKSAIEKALNHRFVLPIHDRPAVAQDGHITGRLFESVPGPVTPLTDALATSHLNGSSGAGDVPPAPAAARIDAQPLSAAAPKKARRWWFFGRRAS